MRISFLNLALNPLFNPSDPGGYGGAEVQLYLLATGLAAEGLDVHVVTRGVDGESIYKAEGVTIHTLSKSPGIWGKIRTVRDIIAALKMVDADIDIQRCGGVETYLAGRTAKRRGKRFVFMCASNQDCIGEVIGNGGPLTRYFFHRGLWLADRVVVQNDKQAEMFTERWNRPADVLLSACRMLEQNNSETDGSVLWMGRCEPYKGPEVFLELASKQRKQKFVMVMPTGTDNSYDTRVRVKAHSLNNVELHGAVPLKETGAFFERAFVHVNTSDFEGFPNTFLQAAAAGIPVVSLNVDPGGVFEREGFGLCAQGDLEVMSGMIAGLCGDEKQRIEMGERGRAYIRAHHAQDVIVKRFRVLLEEIV